MIHFSQGSFLIHTENVSGRLMLLVTLFFVEISIFTTITSSSPNVEGLSAISAWALACILFVFVALVVYVYELLNKYWMLQVRGRSFESLITVSPQLKTW